ncbi:MAG: permease prefix domain 1-containing protein [Planctomycetaceae bacterium]
MSEREFELYLSLMSKLLRLGPEQTASISDELRDHFDERFEDLCRQGVPREQAIRQALDEFGDAAGLAADFTQLARTRRRRLIMRFSLATVFLAAAALMITRAVLPPNPDHQRSGSSHRPGGCQACDGDPRRAGPRTADID